MTSPKPTDTFDERQLNLPEHEAVLDFLNKHGQEFTFHALPDDVAKYAKARGDLRHFTLRVVKQGKYGWSVRDLFDDALSATGQWRQKYNNRTEKAKSYTSFPLPKAIELARKEAAKMKAGRYTVDTYVAMAREEIAQEKTKGQSED
jgi:hypothetical protein